MSVLPAVVPPEWVFYLSRPSGPNVGALGAARTRRLSFALDGPASVTFTMPGDHPDTAMVEELATDVICGRNGVALFRGRVIACEDTLSANVATTTFTAVDYRGLLGRRILWEAVRRSFRGDDQADIAWALIADTQALAGGGLGITRGNAPPTGRLRDRDYDPGKNLGEALDQLGQVIDGFEWEIDAGRRFNLWYPQRGRQTGLVLTYGRDITDLRHGLSQAPYANALRFNGSEQTAAVEVAVDAFPAEIGRWDAQRSDVNLTLQTTVDERARSELGTASALTPAFSVAVAAGLWDPAQLWLGDTARLVVRAGRLDIDTTRRIVGVDISLDDDGGEVVRLSIGDAEPALSGRLISYNSRLKDLERGGGYIPDLPVGGMFDWPGTSPPQLCMWADGSVLLRAQYDELYKVIGTTFGGDDAAGTFNLPNCTGRMTLAAGAGHPAGSFGGAETVALGAGHNGIHSHAGEVLSGGAESPHGHEWSATSTGALAPHGHPWSATSTGALAPHTHLLDFGWAETAPGAPGGFFAIITGVQFGTLGENQAHQHNVRGNTGGENDIHQHEVSGNTGGENDIHQHEVSGNTAGETQVHQHRVTIATDGGGSAGVPHENMPPWIAIGKVIKVIPSQNAGRYN